jgi:Uma2 family endonuclease
MTQVSKSSAPFPNTEPYLLDIAQYHKMLETGILARNERYELIRGFIYKLMPIGSQHIYKVKKLEQLLEACLADSAVVFTQSPVQFLNDSEPQPDILVVKPPLERYRERLPQAEDVLLIIEVADSTLAFDRSTKAELYAQMGIPEYWIVNLKKQQLEINRNPDREERLYREKLTLGEGEKVRVESLGKCEIAWWE